MILNPIIAMLLNTTTNRFHPILFQERPLPSSYEENSDSPVRHKSKGHHSTGFDTRVEAISECNRMAEQLKEDNPRFFLDTDFNWDEDEGIPARVEFFDTEYLTTPNL